MAKDEKIYAAVLDEFSSGVIDRDTMAKAFILANGDQELAKYKYLNLKVESLKKDSAVTKSKDFINKASFGVSSLIESKRSEKENAKKTAYTREKKEEKDGLEGTDNSENNKEKDDKAVEIFCAIVIIAVMFFLFLNDQY